MENGSLTPSSLSTWIGLTATSTETSMDYKHVSFDRNRTFAGHNQTNMSSQFILTDLLSTTKTPEMTTDIFYTEPTSSLSWQSVLLSTLVENLTTITNNVEMFSFGEAVLRDSNNLTRCDNGSEIFNCSVQDYMEYMRGPQTLPVHQAIIVTIVYVIIFLTGVIGNVIVCVVIVRNSTMHTATNYYLFSLAVSDLLFLLMGVPNEVALYWRQYPYWFGLSFCKMRALISEASTYVSVLTIVAFTMERFLAICHPLHLYTMSGFKRALRIIAALWCISFLSAIPFAVYTQIDILTYPADGSEIPDSAFCAMLTGNPNGFPLWEVSTCVFFVIPMTVIMVLYVRIGLRIRSRTKHTQALGVTQGSLHGESRQTQSRKAILRMLAAVVITFFVFWAPFHAQRLLFLHGQNWEHYKTVNEWLFVFGGTLYYVSCTINPILYNVMSHRYRKAFKETLCGKRRSYFGSNAQTHSTFLGNNQSSFRETIIADTGNQCHESSRLLRIKSVFPGMRCSSRLKTPNSGATRENSVGGNIKWKDRINIHSKDAKVIKDEKLPIDNVVEAGHRKSDVLVVLENNRNGTTKCYSTSAAAALINRQRVQSPLKITAPPLAEPIVEDRPALPEPEEKQPDSNEGVTTEINGLTLVATAQQSPQTSTMTLSTIHEGKGDGPTVTSASPLLLDNPSDILKRENSYVDDEGGKQQNVTPI